MAEDRNSYRNITKSIGIFGGTRVFQILVGLVKNKIIAVLLGPVGVGIQGMLQSTIGVVLSATGFGLHTSAVRDVAQAYSTGEKDRINKTITILRKLVVLTGLLGTLIVFFFAGTLSEWSFGNKDYTIAFRLLSIVLLFEQLVIGQNVLLQGTFHYKYLAIGSLWGSIVSLVICVPIYYIWGVKGIVPVMIITAIINFIIYDIYARKVPYEKQHLSMKQVWIDGRIMMTLGLAIALSGVLMQGQIFLIRSYITNTDSLEAVGLYTAGSAFVTQYVNLLFQAMARDYSPRLASVSNNLKEFVNIMNRQAVLLVTIASPLIIIFIVFAKQLIIILYSSKFLPIIGMIEWMMAGMMFRSISWSISYGFAARGNSKMFFLNELIATIYGLLLVMIGYKIYGFSGIGIAMCLTNLIYAVQEYFFGRRLFKYRFNHDVKRKCIPMILLFFSFFIVIKMITVDWLKLAVGVIAIAVICLISYQWLDQMINIKASWISLKNVIRKDQ